ncbi:MAG: hypothetical protein WCK70_17280 [Chloroflexales bacterium]|jgi:hypothetical protein
MRNPFRSKALPSDGVPIKHPHRTPGKGATSADIFEVWGDLIDLSDRDSAEIAYLGRQATAYMREQITRLLDLNEQQHPDFSIDWCSDSKEQPYLLVKCEDMQGEIGARPFGRCLDLFGILIMSKGLLINSDPNPLVRLSKLDASKRRDVTIFQSLLKYVLDQTGEAIDEQRIV